ncbi:hypothetical protein [Flavivirga rizhaonensis]
MFQQSYIEDCEVYCCNPYSIIS